MDTIFAPATAAGRAGVAIIRISGPDAFIAAQAIGASLTVPRRLERARLATADRHLDDAMAVGFPMPRSYTGENCVELHLHGGRATLEAVMSALSQAGLRLAEPGEFTRRAVENGKISLDGAEGLVDLIDAETDAQRVQALRQMDGALSRQVSVWREGFLHVLALLEAAIDFSEEELPAGVVEDAVARLHLLRDGLATELEGMSAARAVRDGFEVAIVGAPNLGKSTLLNAISRREAALTSPLPGTTRDVIEVRVDLKGLPVVFLDTAGLRETSDPIEAMGVARGKRRAVEADLRILLVASEEDLVAPDDRTIVRLAQGDLLPIPHKRSVSGTTGYGVPELLAEVHQRLGEFAAGAGLVVQERHRIAVGGAVLNLDLALSEVHGQFRVDVVCEHIRVASKSLAVLTGGVDTEEVLGAIFSRFCIGK